MSDKDSVSSSINKVNEEIIKIHESTDEISDKLDFIHSTLCEMGQIMEKDLRVKCRLCDCIDTLTLLKTLDTFEDTDYTEAFTRKELTSNIINRCTEIMNYK